MPRNRRTGAISPLPDRNYAAVLRGQRHMEKMSEIVVQTEPRPQVDLQRELGQVALMQEQIGG